MKFSEGRAYQKVNALSRHLGAINYFHMISLKTIFSQIAENQYITLLVLNCRSSSMSQMRINYGHLLSSFLYFSDFYEEGVY